MSENVDLNLVNDNIAKYDSKFGQVNLVSGVIRRLEINLMISEILHEPDSLNILREKLKEYDALFFKEKKANPIFDTCTNFSNGGLYSFSKELFQKHYEHEPVFKNIKLGSAAELEEFQFGVLERYMYVIDARGELQWHATPVDLQRTIKGKKKGDDTLVHPMLSAHTNFEVKVAGEFSILSSPNSSSLAIYIDNMSGHFKPYKVKSSDLLQYTKEVFKKSLPNLKHAITFSFNEGHHYEKL